MSVALVLAGHGSHISANTAGVVWEYVDRLRAWGVADEVAACFWKEPPAFSQILDTVAASEIVVVPLFTARGYFAGDVIPAEMRLTGAKTERDGKRIQLTRPIGEHEYMQAIVRTRLRETLEKHALPPADTAAVIIGHGTRRMAQSRDATRRQTEQIRALNWLREAVDVYLDDEPGIPSLFERTAAPNVVALPYFLAKGSHVTRDVPRALGITELDALSRVRGRSLAYCAPVGSHDSICRVILDLARETGLPFAETPNAEAWSGFPQIGKAGLTRALAAGEVLRFGELLVTERRVWHANGQAETRAIDAPGKLRRIAREAPFRPLPTSADLPGGWHVDLAKPEDAFAVIETVYPGLLADWAAKQSLYLKTETLQDIGERQTGMFKDIHRLPKRVFRTAIETLCGSCIREPSWWRDGSANSAKLPCRGPCNLLLSQARALGEAI